ncbi:DMT family transporter [Candidatus Woesearchaeota archaeon]|nr:DMT family transporter [Candidatus Woesearchaeota archaeon]
MVWVIFALLAAATATVVNIADKFIVSNELKSPVLATLFSGAGNFMLFILASLIIGDIFLPWGVVLIAVLTGVLYNLSIWLYYVAMSREEVSRCIPIFSTTPVFVLPIAFFLFDERFSALTYAGVGLMVAGAVLLSIKKSARRFRFSSAILIALGSTLLIALRNILAKHYTLQASMWSLFFWVSAGGIIVSLALIAAYRPRIRKRGLRGAGYLVIIGMLTAVSFFLFTAAISRGPVSLVSAFMEVQPLLVFLAATALSVAYPMMLKERITRAVLVQKSVAILMVMVGAFLIS